MLCKMSGDQLSLFIEILDFPKIKNQQVDNVIIKFFKDQSSETRIWPDDHKIIDYITMFLVPGSKAGKNDDFWSHRNTHQN